MRNLMNQNIDELGSIGLSLAKSAAFMQTINTYFSTGGDDEPVDCLDAALMKPLRGKCSQQERLALARCFHTFCTRHPLVQSTPHAAPKEATTQAHIIKPPEEIAETWKTLFEWRRKVGPNDRNPIPCHNTLAMMWNEWREEWFVHNLTANQKKKLTREKTSIFNAYVKRTAGTKFFVMAIWQLGVPWAPPLDKLNSDLPGALEHVATHFAQWCRQLARSIVWHKTHPDTQEAIRRSGKRYGQHGLTELEQRDRKDRRDTQRDYYFGFKLHLEDLAAKRHNTRWPAANSKKRNHAGKGVAEHSRAPRRYDDMQQCEKWWIDAFRSGRLHHSMMEARRRCHAVQAPRFLVQPLDKLPFDL